MIQSIEIPITKIVGNKGQIAGLPKNPRIIKDDKFEKLLKSLEDDPEMMELREIIVIPHENHYIAICGNMRLKALQELKIKTAICKILPIDTPVEKLKAYTVKDNVSFGMNDWDLLANEWEPEQLADWGVDLPILTDLDDSPDANGNDSESDIESKICLCPKCGFSWQEE
jgi:ParB-like chromosome segregation protein Spo0J